MAEVKTPVAAKAKTGMTTKKDKIKVLKTFVWSAEKKDTNVTFLAGDTLVGFPSSDVDKFEKAGFLELPVKDED